MSDIAEVKNLIQEQGEAWHEFKKTNDDLLKAKADGRAVTELQTKLDAISAGMDAKSEKLKALEDAVLKAAAPGAGSKSDEDLQAEVKTFNLHMRSDFQSKGRSAPAPMTVEDYPAYKSGFLKVTAGVKFEHLTAAEQKAMSAGSDPDGGYLLPASTAGRVVAKRYEQSVMRQIATVQQISSGSMEGIVDNDEMSAGWVSEIGTRSDTNTATVGKYRIDIHEMYASPKATQTLIDDAAVDLEAWIAAKVADKLARVEGLAFWRGTGVGQPKGLATYTTAATADESRAWGQFEHVNTGANGAFHTTKADPIQDLLGAMKDQYLTNANFVMRREVRTLIRKLKEATSDRYLWEPSLQAGQPDRLLGYPVRIDQYMPTIATGSLSLAFGDFREAYTILDRVGIRTLRDPFTAKPYIVFYTTARVGGAAVNFEAVKFLRFAG